VALTVLLVGGAGYVGSATALHLVQQGRRVIILDAFLHNQTVTIPGATIVRGGLDDHILLEKLFQTYSINAVMHFAGSIEVGRSVIDPAAFYENNVVNSKYLLDAMRRAGVKRCIFSSTCALYAPVTGLVCLTENHPINPASPYGKTKYAVECMLQDYAHAYGMSYVALRYFNAAGALPEDRIGEQHQPETHVIPALFAAVDSGKPFHLLGDDYPTPDGTCIRDYVHIHDLARAHVRALEHLENGGASMPINLGTGRGYSVRELLACVEQASGRQVPYVVCPRRSGDVPFLVADASRACEVLGWTAERSSLATIVADAWAFHRAAAVAGSAHDLRQKA